MEDAVRVGQSKTNIHWRNVALIGSFHVLAIPAVFVFSWANLAALLIGNWIAGSLGIGIGYHRLLTHRGFKVSKWLEYTLTTFGMMAMQDDAIRWVANHRIHHQHSDTPPDPHNIHFGLLWAHVTWMLVGTAQDYDEATLRKYVPGMLKDRGHVFLARIYYVPIILSGFLLFAIGGWSMVVWGVFLRVVVLWHSTWLVNSAAHAWGRRRFATKDNSTNNWWVAILTFGEGWHNNHHAYPTSARHGLKWYELDMSWMTIRAFEALGLAKEIRTYQRKHPRARDLVLGTRLVAGDRSAACTIENLSIGGAALVTDLELTRGEEVELVVDVKGTSLTLPARVYRVDARPDQPLALALMFRKLPADVQSQLDEYVQDEIEQRRSRSPEAVVLVGLSPQIRADLVQELTALGRVTMIAPGPLEAMWYLQDRGYNIDTVIVDDEDAETAAEFLAFLTDGHPHVRRILSARAPDAIPPELAARSHRLLTSPWHRDDLEAALRATSE